MISEETRRYLKLLGKQSAEGYLQRQAQYGRDALDAFRAIAAGQCEHLPPVMLDILIGEAANVRLAKLKDTHGGLWIATLEQIGTALDRARKVLDHQERRGRKRIKQETDEVVAERLRKRFDLDTPKPPVNVIPIEHARSRKGPYAKT